MCEFGSNTTVIDDRQESNQTTMVSRYRSTQIGDTMQLKEYLATIHKSIKIRI